MFKMQYLLFCLLGVLILETNAHAVFVVKPCKAADKACLLSNAKEGLPYFAHGDKELGIPSSDPLFIDEIKSHQHNLDMKFMNSVITGASKANILHLERDVEKNIVKITLEIPLHITGQYDLHGKILFLHAVGNGDYEFKTKKMLFSIEAKYKIIEKNNEKYWKLVKSDYTYDFVEKVFIKLDNLFGGDAAKAKPIHDILNDNWKEIIEDMGKPIIDTVVNAFCSNMQKWFLTKPTNTIEIL